MPYDQLAKQLLKELLELAGPVRIQQEVAGEAQWIDVWFAGEEKGAETLARLGLLGRLAARPCLLEHFSETPRLREFYRCFRKLFTWYDILCREAGSEVPLPRLWMLSQGRRSTAMESLRFQAAPEWSDGVYRTEAEGMNTGIGSRGVIDDFAENLLRPGSRPTARSHRADDESV